MKPVEEMTHTEVLLEAQRRDANRKAGRPLDYREPEASAKDASASEKAEQAHIVKMARALGFVVHNLSQARASKQTPGLPDLWLTHANGWPNRTSFAGWFETKRQVGGKRSSAQIEFADACICADVFYAWGDRHDFAAWLRFHGFTVPEEML